MAKITWKPGTLEYPLPPVMISCGTMEKPNIMTAAWTGIVSSEPPMTYVSIRPERYSHQLIKENGEFVINLTTLQLITAADYCGVKSGRDIDKFKQLKLTAGKCSQVAAPQIVESPVSLECKVKSITNYGSHDMFLAEIVAVNVDDNYVDEEGKLSLEKTGLIAYSHGNYYTLGRNVGFYGFSVCKSAVKAKEKMKNVVVEIKESKIVAVEDKDKNKKRRTPWGTKSPTRRKFGEKRGFEGKKACFGQDKPRIGRSKPAEKGKFGNTRRASSNVRPRKK